MKPTHPEEAHRRADAGAIASSWKQFGGQTCLIRPLHHGDETALQDFFRSHTSDTIYERYGCLVSAMSSERASQLVTVDQSKDCALGIFTLADHGEKLHAVGRYCLDPAGDSAELAFVVSEARRHEGMATALLRLLIRRARTQGLSRLWAQVHTHNSSMLGIFRRLKFALEPQSDAGIECATLVLERKGIFGFDKRAQSAGGGARAPILEPRRPRRGVASRHPTASISIGSHGKIRKEVSKR